MGSKDLNTKNNILLLLAVLCLGSQWAMGQGEGLVSPVFGWHAYTSHKVVVEISVLGDSAYAITTGGLIRHNLRNSENVVFTTVEGLSSVDPTTVLADPGTRRVFIGYKDGSINYFDPEGQIHVITDISRNEQFSSKRINHFFAQDGLLYIATDFGLVVYDILAQETRYSVSKISNNATGSLATSCTIAEDRLYLAMGTKGIWSVDLLADNPTLPSNWQKESGAAGLSLGASNYVCADKQLLFAQVEDTIFQKWPNQGWTRSSFPTGDVNYLNSSAGNVYCSYRRSLMAVLYPDSNLVVADNFSKIKCVAVTPLGDLIIGDSLAGLLMLRFGTGLGEIGPECPKNNNVADMASADGELYVAPKGRQGSSGRAYDKSGVPFFDLHNGGWEVLDHITGPLSDVFQDFYRVAIDSASGRCIMGSWGEGLIEMLHGDYVRSYTAANSGLSLGSAGHMVGGLEFDEFGNLWIAQSLNNYPLQCLTPEGEWHSFQPPFGLFPIGLKSDALGNKWIINNGLGVAVFNDNYTPDNPADDKWLNLTSEYGRGGLPNNTVLSIAEDHDLQIWIGTSEGVTIMYDPTLLFTNDFQDAACPIIEGYCLFRDQQVNDIVVDGYNRKWIATENGAFLVNLDGTELLQHFTAANSPLLDDDVRDIAIDPQTGEVFFGTAKGIISYIGDAIDGQVDAENLYAYPNPAFVDQETQIMIKGMRRYSKVKITTASGRLVRELDSQGGEVGWDLHDSFGNRITPGIYLVMVADPEGKGAGITKIAVIEKQN